MFRPMLKMQCFFCLFIVFCEIAIGQDGTPSDQFVPLEMVGGVYDSRYKPLSAVWKLRKTEFRKRIYTLKGEVRVANEGDHPIEFSVPNDFVLVTLRNSKGESVVQAKDLLPPTEPAMNGIAHLSAFREVEFLKNGVHQKGAGRELIPTRGPSAHCSGIATPSMTPFSWGSKRR